MSPRNSLGERLKISLYANGFRLPRGSGGVIPMPGQHVHLEPSGSSACSSRRPSSAASWWAAVLAMT